MPRLGGCKRLAFPVAEFARIRAIRGPGADRPEVLATSATSEACVSPHWHAKQVRASPTVHVFGGRTVERNSTVAHGADSVEHFLEHFSETGFAEHLIEHFATTSSVACLVER